MDDHTRFRLLLKAICLIEAAARLVPCYASAGYWPLKALLLIIINKILIKVMLNKIIAGALYIVICG